MALLPQLSQLLLLALLELPSGGAAFEYHTFDGPGVPSCQNVVAVHNATSVVHMAALVRAAGRGHQWYDTHCSDDATVLIRTDALDASYDFDPAAGSVSLGPGVTFFQLAASNATTAATAMMTGLLAASTSLGLLVSSRVFRCAIRIFCF